MCLISKHFGHDNTVYLVNPWWERRFHLKLMEHRVSIILKGGGFSLCSFLFSLTKNTLDIQVLVYLLLYTMLFLKYTFKTFVFGVQDSSSELLKSKVSHCSSQKLRDSLR